MTPPLHVAALQLHPAGPAESSLDKGLRFCSLARRAGADIVLFPEMWSTGYACRLHDDGHVRFSGPAESRSGPFLAAFQDAAARLRLAIAVTYLESRPSGLANSAALIDRSGSIVLHYSKLHTCSFDEPECFLTPGDSLDVCLLDTDAGPVAAGLLICFDREFPESARLLASRGAELILVPNCCELELHRLAQLDARAFENMTAIAVANYPSPKANGRSLLLDGIAFDSHGRSRSMHVFHAGDSEAVLNGPLQLDALRAYRRAEPWGPRHPRADFYSQFATTETRS